MTNMDTIFIVYDIKF